MSVLQQQIAMITQVATALDDLLDEVVFVGGCVTGLLVNDDFTLEQIRFTEDVDLIVNVITHADWRGLQTQLRKRGFKEDMSDTVICRMNLGKLKVDIMPVEKDILGFSNQWYKEAIKNSLKYQINPNLSVNIISPIFYIATKIDAYLGRGKGDLLASHDIEDLITVFDGRTEIVTEYLNASDKVKSYIAKQLHHLMLDDGFEYVVQGVSRNNVQRENLIIERIGQCIN